MEKKSKLEDTDDLILAYRNASDNPFGDGYKNLSPSFNTLIFEERFLFILSVWCKVVYNHLILFDTLLMFS